MAKLITKSEVKAIVNETEKTMHSCFNMLLTLKHGNDGIKDVILYFQPSLAECLYKTMTFYQSLKSEEKFIVSHKDIWSCNYFERVIKSNAKYRNIIREVIEIGKSLGDAFAWFFYSRNRQELDHHFEHETTGLFPSGIGGLGEIEFIKNNQNVDGLYVIYHGITNMLRVGDFSLFQPDLGIVGIGELKTNREGNNLNIVASISSKVDINLSGGNSELNRSMDKITKVLHKEHPQLSKQIRVQERLICAKDSEHSSDMFTDYDYYAVDYLNPNNRCSYNSDNTMLLFAQWSKYSSLFDSLYYDEKISIPIDITENAKSLIVPESKYNEVIIGSIDTKMIRSRIPVLWWNINDTMCRDLYFKHVNISTTFNPASLIQRFVNIGFVVKSYGNTNNIILVKEKNGKRAEFSGLSSYFDLVQGSLMKPDSVFLIAKEIMDAIDADEIPAGTKINMNIHLNNFGPPSTQTS